MARTARYDRQTAVSKATRLFWDRGYHACSLKQLEQSLDMRPGSIYAMFGSKEGLFREALESYFNDMGEQMSAHLDASPSPLEGLKSYIRSLPAQCARATEPDGPPTAACMMVKTLLETGEDVPELRDTVNRLFDDIEQRLTGLLEQAVAEGELPENTDCGRLARLLQAQIIGLRSFAQRRIEPEKVRTLADDMLSLIDMAKHRQH